MGSDRARATYDPRQQYRSVVMQQGRVTLEADWNEGQQIFTEEMRKEALDFVGPSGTPDDGYGIVLPARPTNPPFDFSIGPGIMYVGGVRAQLDQPVQYSNQPDWLDHGPDDPDWVDLPTLSAHPIDEFVYLLLREQEVSAVEDPDLKDVALGGPDTAQRTRLLQRFVRIASQGASCDAGLAAAETKWATEGLRFDPANMRLLSESTLQVQFSGQSQTDPCQPTAQGGYLAPDNQLIRVQISGVDPATGRPKFLWGFDDASFLYRIDIDPNNSQNLIPQSTPVDSYHQPQVGQAVEILRSAAELNNGGFVAALSGFVVTLDQSYQPDSQSIALPSGVNLPDEFLTANASPPAQLFLRVWQQEVVFTPGTAAPLGDTGLQVTLQTLAAAPFHLGDYWLFAVRPATPQVVYPERYLAAPQPPDGPRLWACPLGVIGWLRNRGTVVADCRNTFCNLVELSKKQQGCCTITVSPQMLTAGKTLQSIVNQASRPTMLVQAAFAGAAGNNITIGISNLQTTAATPVFDLTVTEVDTYTGITVSGLAAAIGNETSGPNDGLAHVVANSINSKLAPLNNQTVVFTGGQAGAKARVNILDTSNQLVAFTLEARAPGTDGNITSASISNVTGTPTSGIDTFDLNVTWQRRLSAVSMATLFTAIQNNFSYEIVASPPVTALPAIPTEGSTRLTGGVDAVIGATSAATAQAALFGSGVKICLRPGNYRLPAPLTFGVEQSNITLEACGPAVISASPEQLAGFTQGLLQINGAAHITLRGLAFSLPRALFSQSGLQLANLSTNTLASMGEAALINLDVSIGIMATGVVVGFTVDNCIFDFPQLLPNEVLFGEAISAAGACSNVTLRRNAFHGPPAPATSSGGSISGQLCSGYIQTDTLQSISLGPSGASVSGGTLGLSSLDDFVVEGNSFENLAFPVYITSVVGTSRFDANTVRSSLSGFTIVPLVGSVAAANQALANDVRTQLLQNPAAQRMASLAMAFPRPAASVPSRQIVLGAPPSAPASAAQSHATLAPIVPTAPILNPVAPVLPTTPIVNPVAPTGPAQPVSPVAPPTPVPPTPVPPPPLSVLRLANLSPLTARLAELLSNIPVSQIVVIPPFINPNFSLRLTNNDIEVVLTSSVWALAVLDLATLTGTAGTPGSTTYGSVTLSGNQLRSSTTSSAVEVTVQFSAVTGNVILNEAGGSSLAIVVTNAAGANTATAAITGNVLRGPTNLPPRAPASLPDWTTYNTLL